MSEVDIYKTLAGLKTVPCPTLDWEIVGSPISHDDDYLYNHVVRAIDNNGVEYEGIGAYSCGELIGVEDIEIM